MTIRIKPDALLAVGSGGGAVDLVARSTGQCLPLSSDEATVAMLLIGGVANEALVVALLQPHGVSWDLARTRTFLKRLEAADFLVPEGGEREDSQRPSGVDDLVDEAETVIDPFAAARAGRTTPEPAPRTPIIASTTAQPQPLATAATMLCEGRHAEAEAVLLAILAEDPGNVQAQAMLTLMAARGRGGSGASGRRWRFVAVAVLGLLMGAALGLGFLVQVPVRARVACTTHAVALAPAIAPMAGEVWTVSAAPGQVVARGQVLAAIRDPAVDHLAEPRERLESDEELLRILRTGGTIADIKAFKQRLADLRARALQDTSAALKQRIEETRNKLRFCDWQPTPAEVAEVSKRITRRRAELTSLAARPPHVEVRSLEEGRLETILARGTRVAKGEVVARLVHPRRLVVQAPLKAPAKLPAVGQALDVALGRGQRLRSVVERVAADGLITGHVDGDPALLRGASCAVELRVGQTSWFSAKLRRLTR
jgi:hypothetical protein